VKSELRGFTFYIKSVHIFTRIYVFIYKEGLTKIEESAYIELLTTRSWSLFLLFHIIVILVELC